MQIQISAQHFSLGQALQTHIREKLTYHVTKYFDHTISCEVHFNKVNHWFLCDIVVHTGVRATIVSEAQNSDPYAAFDICLAKIDSRLRKYKSKLKDYHQKMKLAASIKSKKYIIDLPHEDSSQDTAAEGFMTEQAPNEILILSLDEAIMKIDLEGLSALIFTNVENHKLNFIYYKKNGKIALIDIDG